jgi:hypothetical protein
MQVPGGRVDVRFVPEVINHVVADAGDYIYPSDVRVSAASDQLYVKAAGITAAFPRAQTWLFEYDLRRRKRTGRIRVDPQALPAECPATESPR